MCRSFPLLMQAVPVTPDEPGFREMFDNLPAAVYRTNVAGLITYYNPAAARLWGVEPELGKSAFCGHAPAPLWCNAHASRHSDCPLERLASAESVSLT
jgi:two-component system CheB/CheR fusion protein